VRLPSNEIRKRRQISSLPSGKSLCKTYRHECFVDHEVMPRHLKCTLLDLDGILQVWRANEACRTEEAWGNRPKCPCH
jgi:hypothetical protein